MTSTEPVDRTWTRAEALEEYLVRDWGGGFFDVSEQGHAIVHPRRRPEESIDLKVLVDELQARGIQLPILLRLSDLLEERLIEIHSSFERAISEYGYRAGYRGVYPVKVNEHRHVVDAIVRAGRSRQFGLEAGSKPELLTVLGQMDVPDGLVICNGYKDEEFIELALLGRKVGIDVVLVVEKFSELPMILDIAERLGVEPSLGVRVRLSSRGAGKWQESGGDRSKFGLGSVAALRAVRHLAERDKLGCLTLLHFHLGSQICSVSPLRSALREAARYFIELTRLGAKPRFLDVGGGLAVDYDGSRTDFASSANYTVQEYANSVVWELMSALDEAGIDHPIIVSESGRALTAYHSVLLTNVLGVTAVADSLIELDPASASCTQLREIEEIHRGVCRENFQETYHDAKDLRMRLFEMFKLGMINLEQHAIGESYYGSILRRIRSFVRELDYVPEELAHLERELSDIYFVNMSVFQSLPDSWAIGQVFPILPIHRLDERPDRSAVLADITCDSDGKIDCFVGRQEVRETIPLHSLRPGEPYVLGIFLVGAYQEILGDLHNLFGDNNAVHISWDEDAETYRIDHVEDGDTVTEVLAYVQHARDELIGSMRRKVELALRKRRVSIEEARQIVDTYRAGFEGYTYMEG